jgi:PhoPQ-activated pathogenicity-related protein
MQAFPTFPRMQSLSVAVLAGAQCLVAGRVEAGDAAKKTPLQDYVSQKDDSFSWKQVNRKQVGGLSSVRLEFVSQTWRGHPWRHEMLIVRPAEARNPDIGFLLVSGDGGVDKSFELLRLLAVRAGAAAAVINHVPNQPLYDGRKEDALIAYTFDQYVRSGDTTWPLLFPMVKSAVRGMDVMEAVAQKEFGAKINRFVMSGASKRGWTTWLTGAIDPRVEAIAPMVFDMLNMKVQTQWAEQMYGRQSEQIQDYTQYRFDARMDEPRVVELRGWIDPFSYKSRYNIPKLILLGTNDPYWVVDSLRHYWSALPEPKLIFQTPNAGHDLAGGGEAHLALAMFYQMVADHQTMPTMTWQFQTNSTNSAGLEVIASQPAKTFRLWTATSRDRDFRDDQWSSVVLTSNVPRVATSVKSEPGRYRAYLVEAEFTASTGHNFKLSTEARVIPDGPPAAIKPRE